MLELLLEIILDVFGEFIAAAAFEALSHALGGKRRTRLAMAVPGWVILGGVSGLFSVAAAPQGGRRRRRACGGSRGAAGGS
jgi:hypothetical protein